MLIWAKEQKCPWNSQTTIYAADFENYDILKWAIENKCPVNSDVCMKIAKNGNLEMLKWARMHNCPWNIQTANVAALNGNLEILKWIYENGCPWDVSISKFAKNHLDCYNFIMENQNQIKSEIEIIDNDKGDFVDSPISKFCLFCSDEKINRVFITCGHGTCYNCFVKNNEKCPRCI
jgi:hypothetical protein